MNGRHTARSRAAPQWVAGIRTLDGHQVLRVDDAAHPDFWLEVEMPTGVGAKIVKSLLEYEYEQVRGFLVDVTREEWESFKKQIGVP